ncbi:MAG TPA: hypothetical protein VFA18_10610 [Gemmataceae bacterium]|nr:hypothetical protein [Gemmataceae bacterium]
MADKTTQLVLDALGQAAAEPAGIPLYASKGSAGMFATNAAGKQAAQRCKDDGFLRVLRTEPRGKTTHEICAITEKGLAHLLSQVSPRAVLEDLVRALDAREAQVAEWVVLAQQARSSFDGLKAIVERVLQQVQKPAQSAGPGVIGNGSDAWLSGALAYLAQWHASGASEDCPLPDLYRQAKKLAPHLSIGHFHDGLRRLHDQEHIYLHPWTGPLYDIPEPPYALLIGHEIAYYASLRPGK